MLQIYYQFIINLNIKLYPDIDTLYFLFIIAEDSINELVNIRESVQLMKNASAHNHQFNCSGLLYQAVSVLDFIFKRSYLAKVAAKSIFNGNFRVLK